MERVGILGGSFNPVHHGHLILAQCVQEAAGLDRVLVIPAALSPGKDPADMLPAGLRLQCLRAAFAGLPAFVVDGRELQRPGPSFTVDTLRELTREAPNIAWHLIVGADALRSLPQWREVRVLTELTRFLWVPREGSDDPEAVVRAALPGARMEKVPCPRLDIRAQEIRQRMRDGRSLRGWVPESVEHLLSRPQSVPE